MKSLILFYQNNVTLIIILLTIDNLTYLSIKLGMVPIKKKKKNIFKKKKSSRNYNFPPEVFGLDSFSDLQNLSQ